ncbi:MASE1 domain-containing protein [Pseudomonas aylmerensis]|uniref:MASE1 domain-containing protein n=1 Tax=Pseudomonas aylmerensis TaxID=1869229 RepID=UPI00130488EE|nr:MASE1 domain-containing protein [Pseudomonas aylmerensis]
MWALTYYVTGVASLAFADPVSGMAIIWFPAGVSVSAFLSSKRAHWPLLFLVLLAARVLLDEPGWQHLPVAVALSAQALAGSVAIAWLVRRFARRGDDLHAIVLWLLATVAVCGAEALLRKAWLILAGEASSHTLMSNWMAGVNGVFFATVVVMNVLTRNLSDVALSAREKWAGAVCLALLAVMTWYVFGTTPHWLTDMLDTDAGAALYFILACLPIALTLAVCVTWRSPGGSLALLVLGSIVVNYTDQQTGPFYVPGLLEGEPLLLAQSYLSITALLVVAIRLMTQAAKPYDPQSGRLAGDGVMYQLHPGTGEILWDDNLATLLDVSTLPLGTVQQVLERVHPEDRDKLKRHWTPATHARAASLAFRIDKGNGDWLTLYDQSPGALRDAHGQVIVGNWQPSRYD